MCHDWFTSHASGWYVCACVNISMCQFEGTWADSMSIRMGVDMCACVLNYVGGVD